MPIRSEITLTLPLLMLSNLVETNWRENVKDKVYFHIKKSYKPVSFSASLPGSSSKFSLFNGFHFNLHDYLFDYSSKMSWLLITHSGFHFHYSLCGESKCFTLSLCVFVIFEFKISSANSKWCFCVFPWYLQ